MKKILLTLAGLLMMCLSVYADTACFHGSTKPSGEYTITQQWTTATAGKVSKEIEGLLTLSFSNGIFNEGDARNYATSTMTLTPAEGIIFRKISFIDTAKKAGQQVTVISEENSPVITPTNYKYVWNGESAEAVQIYSLKQIIFTYIEIEYTAPSGNVENVVFSSTLNGAEATVTLSCATEDATIFYGFDQDNITNEYTDPFKVTESGITTVYTFAQKGEDKSLVKNFEVNVPYTSFKDASEKAKDGQDIAFIGNFEVLFHHSPYLILTDGTSNLVVYDGSLTSQEVGAKIAEIKGSVSVYHELFEVQSVTLTEGGDGATYETYEITSLTDIAQDKLLDEVIIKGAIISGKTTENKVEFATIELGGETIKLKNYFGIDLKNGENYNITGFIWKYGDNFEIAPVTIEGGEALETVKTPGILPDERELSIGDKITITCATPDSKIYYTVDGTDPDENSTLYSDPFEFTEACTVKARAYAENMLASEIAERYYYLFDPTCNVITTSNHEGSGSYTKHTCTIDKVDYAMQAVHNSDQQIQMNSTSSRFCFVIQTGVNEGFVVDNIEIDYDQDKNNINFNVRGANTPFDYDNNQNDSDIKDAVQNHGVNIGTITSANSQNVLEFAKDYKYFALYPAKNGAVYLKSITIRYREPAEIAEAPKLDDVKEEDFFSDESGLKIPNLPMHEDWTPMYQVNDGDACEADGTLYEDELAPASLHTIKIWYEHYNGTNKTEAKEYHHVTAPQHNVTTADDKTTIEFGTIGEGMTVYFTLNGKNPEVTKAAPAKVQARATAKDGAYTIEDAEDLAATHAITSATPTVHIMPIKGTPIVSLSAVAVHDETGLSSSVSTQEGITTGIENVTVAEGEAVYYNLQGVRVENPENGVFVRVQGGKASKVMVK